jgi:hypothetical protein
MQIPPLRLLVTGLLLAMGGSFHFGYNVLVFLFILVVYAAPFAFQQCSKSVGRCVQAFHERVLHQKL